MRYLFAFLILLISAITNSLGQNTFSKIYDFDQGSDTGIYIYIDSAGYFTVNSGSDIDNGNLNSLKLMRLNISGNVVWQKKYAPFNTALSTSGEGSVDRDNEGNFYITGLLENQQINGDMFLFKCNSRGDSIWLTSFGGDSIDAGLGVFYDSSSHLVYCAGYTDYVITENLQAALWSFDSLGHLVDENSYSSYGFDVFSSVIRYEDTLLISGKSFVPNMAEQAVLSKIDLNGNLKQKTFYGTSGDDSEYFLSNYNNRIIGWGQWDTLSQFGVPIITLISNQGEPLWTKYFNTSNTLANIFSAKSLAGGEIVFVGFKLINNIETGWIGKLDSLGNELWSKTYSYYPFNPQSCYLFNFTVDSDNNIIATGFTQHDLNGPNNTGADVWILKLDSNGCLYPEGACETTSIPTVQTIQTKVEVYPNPASSQLHITIETLITTGHISLYNLFGEEVLTQPLTQAQTRLDVSTLPPGVYLYQVQVEGHTGKPVYRTGKVVVE